MITDKDGRVSGSIDVSQLAALYAQADDENLRAHYRQVAAEHGVVLDEQQAAQAEEAVPAEPSVLGVQVAYDPGEHTVADVNKYLDTASPEEQQRVLDAELAGKARKGLVVQEEE